MTEQKNINDLRGNPDNPRTISEHDFKALKRSIDEFGDLSGVVLNVRTGQLVGGHQRVEAFKALGGQKVVEVLTRYETPTIKGTVALGFVNYDGERFSYREVDWPEAKELAANVAANRITGEFDKDLLAKVTYDIQRQSPELLDLTGQTDKEIKKLMQSIGVVEEDPPKDPPADEESDTITFRLTKDQQDLVKRALDHVRMTRDMPAQDADAKNGAALFYMSEHYLSTNPTKPEDSTFIPPELPSQ